MHMLDCSIIKESGFPLRGIRSFVCLNYLELDHTRALVVNIGNKVFISSSFGLLP